MATHRKPTARMIEALRSGAAHKRGIIGSEFATSTKEALVARDLADWVHPEKLGMSVWGTAQCVITDDGRAHLDAQQPETTPAPGDDEITPEDVEEGKRQAMRWMSHAAARRAQDQPASVALAAEFKRAGAVMRRLLKAGGRPEVENQVLTHYNRVTALLAAARRFESARPAHADQPATAAPQEPTEAVRAAIEEDGVLAGYEFTVKMSPRRKKRAATIEPGGSVSILLPAADANWPEEIPAAVRGMMHRIAPAVARARALSPEHPARRLVDGEAFPWLGSSYRLRRVSGGPVEAEYRDRGGWSAWLRADGAELDRRGGLPLIEWYTARGEEFARQDASGRYRQLGLDGDEPTIRVCDLGPKHIGQYVKASHTVELHWALFQLDPRLIQYVITHELVHATKPRERLHHGKIWTARMDQALPGWRHNRERLAHAGRFLWLGETARGE